MFQSRWIDVYQRAKDKQKTNKQTKKQKTQNQKQTIPKGIKHELKTGRQTREA